MAIRAVIVGIEKYAEQGFAVPAPAVNAVAVARWAVRSGAIRPEDILLFVSALDPATTQDPELAGVAIRGTTLDDIDTALRTELPTAAAGSSLFFYWSGHAMTDKIGQRLFFCSDYTRVLANRVFNASLFFRKLRSDAFANYRKMLAVADVCGTNSQLPVEPAVYDPGQGYRREHLIYFATPEGGYATAGTGEGALTYYVLQTLRENADLSDLDSFKDRLDAKLKASDLPCFRMQINSESEHRQALFGIVGKTANQISNSLIELLDFLGVSDADLQARYTATAVALNNEKLFAAEGLLGMVRELSALRDLDGGATHGLVQFVLRLCADPRYCDALKDWLARWAKPRSVETETRRLVAEQGRSLLILDVDANWQGEIFGFRPSLRSLDQTQLRGAPFQPVQVRGWGEFKTAVKTILQRVEAEGFAGSLEIQLIVEANVFDRQFHCLPGLRSEKLGEEFAVVLHHRVRTKSGPSDLKDRWLEQVKQVRCLSSADLAWTRCVAGQALPLNPGLCFLASPPGSHGVRMLDKLVGLGAPFIYWPHGENEPDPLPNLTEFVRRLGISRLPEALLRKRIADETSSGSLLWDDLSFRPYGD